MELGPSFHGLPLAASALLRGRTLTVTEIFSIFFVFFPVQKPQSKKLAFRILSLRSPQRTTGKLQIQKRKRKQRKLRLRNLNCNETLQSSSFAAFFSRATRSDCRKGCRRGRRTGIRYGSPETTGAVSSGIRYDRSETAEPAAPAQ
jgi:hypothetical protein